MASRLVCASRGNKGHLGVQRDWPGQISHEWTAVKGSRDGAYCACVLVNEEVGVSAAKPSGESDHFCSELWRNERAEEGHDSAPKAITKYLFQLRPTMSFVSTARLPKVICFIMLF